MKSDKFTFYVYPHEVDATGDITLCSLGNYILNAAGMSAAKRGFGMEELHKNGFAWVVCRMAVEMSEYPQGYQHFTIETWIENITTITTARNFRIYNSQDQLIGEASTIWSVINFATRKMVNLKDSFFEVINNLIEPTKLSMLAAARVEIAADFTIESSHKHSVVYSDIDINRHVNSMKYLQWIIDSIPMEGLIKKRISRFDINYLSEALYGDNIDITRHLVTNDDNKTLFCINNERGVCCKTSVISSS